MRATRAIEALHGVVPLKFYEGWRGRGQGEMTTLKGTVWHDTVTPYPPQGSWTVANCMKLLAYGREGLRGLLSQFGMEPDGTWWVLGDGKAYHNGYGAWGNNCYGLEVMAGSTVVKPPQIWTPAQFESAAKGTAAIHKAHGWAAGNVQGHKEQDPGRKIDPYGVDMARGRTRVTQYMAGVTAPTAPVAQEDDVIYLYWHQNAVYKTNGIHRSRYGLGGGEVDYIKAHFFHKWLPNGPQGQAGTHPMHAALLPAA